MAEVPDDTCGDSLNDVLGAARRTNIPLGTGVRSAGGLWD